MRSMSGTHRACRIKLVASAAAPAFNTNAWPRPLGMREKKVRPDSVAARTSSPEAFGRFQMDSTAGKSMRSGVWANMSVKNGWSICSSRTRSGWSVHGAASATPNAVSTDVSEVRGDGM